MQLFYELSGSISEPLCTTVEDFAVHTESGGSLEHAEAMGTAIRPPALERPDRTALYRRPWMPK